VPPASTALPAPGGAVPGAVPLATVPSGLPVPVGTPIAPGGPLGTLASLPPLISGLFYGGIIVIALGAGLAIWSILNGTGWRPR
jgi:hypothetical protein